MRISKLFLIFLLIPLIVNIIFFNNVIQANNELYSSFVLLTIQSQKEIILREDFFEILDMEQYILIPLVATSSLIEIELNYVREREELIIYYSETDKKVLVDLKNKIYLGYPEWNLEPPLVFEGDFYVSSYLIEYLIDIEIEWLPRRQELTFYHDKIKIDEEPDDPVELLIRVRPEEPLIEPDIIGLDFSIGSIQYRIGFDYIFADNFQDGNLSLNNRINLHGRAGDWALSAGQDLKYDFTTDSYSLSYPLLRARNTENDRIIIIGDARIELPETYGRKNIRGLYLAYPHQKISTMRSYTSVSGQAEEGSRVRLFVNENFVAEKYIYQGEDSYQFTNVLLRNNRTNIVRVKIIDISGDEKEIVKKLSGSLNIFPDGTNQGVFAIGQYKQSSSSGWDNELAGAQVKYAINNNNSLLWEMATNRKQTTGDEIFLGNLLRLATRSENYPFVIYLDWLSGGEITAIDHGARSSLLYTMDRGHISASLSYIPPQITTNISVNEGGRASFNLQQEISDNWLINFSADTIRSVKEMPYLNINRGYISLDYRDRARNIFSLSGGLVFREGEFNWQDIGEIESNRSSAEISLDGAININNSRLNGGLSFITDRIYFLNLEEYKTANEVGVNLGLNSNITSNFLIGSDIETTAFWFENKLEDIDFLFDIMARLRFGNYTYITLKGSTERVFDNNDDLNSDIVETQRETGISVRHARPNNLTVTGELKNTYLDIIDDSYLSANTSLSYRDVEHDWQTSISFGYLSPVGSRESSQKKASLKFTKGFDSGIAASITASRDYSSIYQEDPLYKISFSLSQVLGFARDKVMGQKFARNDHISYIGGLVYLDLQGTGFRDKEDPLLSDISIFRDGLRASTDEKGYFIFENIRPGLYEVGIDILNLPAEYNVITDSKVVKVRENENIFLEFGLTINGAISGKVFIDKEHTGTYDFADDPLPLVGLEIKELNKRTYTRQDGSFYFENIPLGEYTINILPETLPGGIRLSEIDSVKINIERDNLFHDNIFIPVSYGFTR